jgi:hypothetical protein
VRARIHALLGHDDLEVRAFAAEALYGPHLDVAGDGSWQFCWAPRQRSPLDDDFEYWALARYDEVFHFLPALDGAIMLSCDPEKPPPVDDSEFDVDEFYWRHVHE